MTRGTAPAPPCALFALPALWALLVAHVVIDVVIEAEVSAQAVTLRLATDPNALFIAIGHNMLAAQDEVDLAPIRAELEAYVRDHLDLTVDGAVRHPDEVRLTSGDHLGAPDPAATTPQRLAFTATWRVALTAPATLTPRVFQGSNFASLVQLRVSGAAAPLLMEAGKSCTLSPGGAVSAVPAAPAAPPSFLHLVALGFTHIVPEGLDHILFVLGLYLMARSAGPLLTQITAFTVAHSLTLALSLVGAVSLPSRLVEPLIAASIAFVAIENIFLTRVKPWRWLVVFGFGLIHGLGFASALRGFDWRGAGLVKGIVGFNLGVECGQLSVVAAALTSTVRWWRRPWYRRWVVIPASGLIAAVGVFWAIQRALGYG